jgi:hypothetical protein
MEALVLAYVTADQCQRNLALALRKGNIRGLPGAQSPD